MEGRDIWVTDLDLERLRKLLEGTRLWSSRDREHLEQLDDELRRAHVVPATDIPPEVVTMNTRPRLRDLDSGKDMVFTLVFPSDADVEQGIAVNGKVDDNVASAIQEARRAGLLAVLVTGRILGDLEALFNGRTPFDAIVAENGAVLKLADSASPITLSPEPDLRFLAELKEAGNSSTSAPTRPRARAPPRACLPLRGSHLRRHDAPHASARSCRWHLRVRRDGSLA